LPPTLTEGTAAFQTPVRSACRDTPVEHVFDTVLELFEHLI